MHSCVEVYLAVDLSLGVVSMVETNIGILGGIVCAISRRVVLGVLSRDLDFKVVSS